jgi:hypothetical protein
MELENIRFIQNDDGAEPVTITVTMTILEAIWIAKLAGKQRGASPHSSIYKCLNDNFFNRYWDDGIDEADEYLKVEIPPIQYA